MNKCSKLIKILTLPRFLIKKMKKYKVVFHLDEVVRDRVNLVLKKLI